MKLFHNETGSGHGKPNREEGRKHGRAKPKEKEKKMAAIVCYGPLIDLSKAASHIDEYVQLLVFVHNITPIQVFPLLLLLSTLSGFTEAYIYIYLILQYKLRRKGGAEVIKTDIQVADDTRPFFPVTIWNKQLASTLLAGDIILLQSKFFHCYVFVYHEQRISIIVFKYFHAIHIV